MQGFLEDYLSEAFSKIGIDDVPENFIMNTLAGVSKDIPLNKQASE